ncbi:MAG: amidohydrolase family protein [Alphaproteobacteria bacterium]
MERTLFANVGIFDGSGAPTFRGEVLVEGNRIRQVARGTNQLPREGATLVDGDGATLMPGLVEGHAHPSFTNANTAPEIGEFPPEDHTLLTLRHAQQLLDQGFTSLYSAASAKPRLDIAVRDAINAGHFVGPRIRACSPEITVTGGLGDERKLHLHRESFALIADGADEVRRICRTMVREGVDTLKVNVSGDDFVRPAKAAMTVMTDAEIQAAVEVARQRGKRTAAHARASESVKACVRNGIDIIYHCELADAEAIDMLESAKDRIFCGPAIGLPYNVVNEGEALGVTRKMAEEIGIVRSLEMACETYAELRKRGVRVVPGGDYGFKWTPMGTNARDLEHFVNLFGYSPAEALACATKVGGEIMGMDDLGLVQPGHLADLLLVDGDPTVDIRLLQDRDNLLMIVKDGAFRKAPRPRRRRGAQAAE